MEFEIFKTGIHTSSNGITKEYTIEDLDKIVQSYDPSKYEAPIVIGHPKNNAPAYGWIESLKRVGDHLIAKAKQIVPEFMDALKKGLYKKRSISLNPDGTLRHVGFLGAAPPAVKGLADIKFSDDEKLVEYQIDSTYENSNENFDSDLNQNSAVDFNLLLSKLESTHNVIKEFTHSFKNQNENILALLKKTSDNFNSVNSKLEDISLNDFASKLDEFVMSHKLTPAMKLNLVNLVKSILSYDYSSEEKLSEKVFDDVYKFVSSIPKLFDDSEFALPPDNDFSENLGFSKEFLENGFVVDKKSAALHKKVLELSNSEKIDYSTALNKLINKF